MSDVRAEPDIRRLDRRRWAAATAGAGLYLDYDWLAAGVAAPSDDRLFLLSESGAAACYGVGRDAFPFYDPVRLLFGEAEVAGLAGGLPAAGADELPALAADLRRAAGDRSLVCVAPGFLCGLAGAPAGLAAAVLERARAAGAGSVAALHLPPAEAARFGPALEAAGLAPALVGADCVLDVRWRSLDEYLADPSRRRREQIRREMRRFRAAGLRLEMRGAEAIGPELAELQANVQRKYGHLPDVAGYRRQHELVASALGERVRLFLARRSGRTVGFTLCYEWDGVLYTRSIGFDYAALGADACYFHVEFYGPIACAAERGLREIHYSMESYEAKVWRGCRVRPLAGYVHVEAAPRAALLRCLELGSRARAARLAAFDPDAFAAWSGAGRPRAGAGAR